MRSRFCIFAYGSNMLTARLRQRVRSATPIRIGRLFGHALKWHKKSSDGSGKCNAESTGRNEDVVWGVLFEIELSEKPALDRAEGLGNGYIERQVEITTDRGNVTATAYIATTKDSSLRPYHWYKAFVVAGAKEHELPQDYLRALKNSLSIPDPDHGRAAENERLLPTS